MAVIAGKGVVLKPATDRTILPTGFYYNSAAAANTYYPTYGFYAYVPQGLGMGLVSATFAYKMANPCNLVAVNMIAGGSATGTFFMRVYKNGAVFESWSMGTGSANFAGTLPKGAYPYAVGDILQVYIACTTAGSITAQTAVTLDLAP